MKISTNDYLSVRHKLENVAVPYFIGFATHTGNTESGLMTMRTLEGKFEFDTKYFNIHRVDRLDVALDLGMKVPTDMQSNYDRATLTDAQSDVLYLMADEYINKNWKKYL
jgi:hypothetical protein